MAKKNNSPLEVWEQEQTFLWINSHKIHEPRLHLAYGTLNGVRLSVGLRLKMKRQGNRAGVPDIVLPAKSHCEKYPGLYIELKRTKGGVVSKDQKEYMGLLKEEGYMVVVCKGHREAIDMIISYFGNQF